MLAADRRATLLLKSDTEAVEALAVPRTALPRMQVTSLSSVTSDPLQFRRRGTIVVTNEALDDPGMADLLAGLSLSGVRVVRPHEFYERIMRRASLDDVARPEVGGARVWQRSACRVPGCCACRSTTARRSR